jgi:hypothetical protein
MYHYSQRSVKVALPLVLPTPSGLKTIDERQAYHERYPTRFFCLYKQSSSRVIKSAVFTLWFVSLRANCMYELESFLFIFVTCLATLTKQTMADRRGG